MKQKIFNGKTFVVSKNPRKPQKFSPSNDLMYMVVLDGLAFLRDVLNTACNNTSAAYKVVGRWEGVGRVEGVGWTNNASIHSQPSCVCTVGQTDGHSNPDHTTGIADIKWNSLGPQATLFITPVASQGL